MRLFRGFLMIVAMLSMAVHPTMAAAAHHHANAAIHTVAATHTVHGHHHAAGLMTSNAVDAPAISGHAEHERHCPSHHGGKCCDAACCGPTCFSPLAAAGFSERDSLPAAMPLLAGDLRRTDTVLGLPKRPPIAA